MAGTMSEESGVRSTLEGISSGHRCQSGEAIAEWRSSEQVENGSPSTLPLYWDSDDDDEGAKPSELFGKHTWKIENFSQINKRELRSSVFEAGGYKWYILIYPQGCDVCNHLSLFLCVANHDKLLPGWSHFAQFTIAVVNKDPKKSKYSDTLHRFWKKEHDWGWKKFMELSKVLDGFIDADTLIIKAQVQVIREKANRPFRCLDCQYRRELVRVYLSNVEQICRRYVEERRGKLGKLIEDKARWSSFCTFWLGMDQSTKRHMSKERTDVILKVVVKHFFIEKEVTSTLVMDSLYSGLKALSGQSMCKKGRLKMLESEEIPAPIVRVEKDMFVLVDDVLLLLERASLEPLPPKDEKGPQNRTKDGASGDDFNKDSIERDERRLTELGRRTVEIFILAHIFSNKIEAAYQEAVALKRQEELIREEEEAGLAENEQKAKRGGSEKEKKSKKRQAKQKRNSRKGKDKGRDEKLCTIIHDIQEQENASDDTKQLVMEQAQPVPDKTELLEDASDVSDSVDGVVEHFQPDLEERDSSPVNWDTDLSEVPLTTEASSGGIPSIQNGTAEKKSSSVMDDSSSTCSTDSVPSVVMNGPYKGNSFCNHNAQKSPSRRKNQQVKATNDGTRMVNEMDDQPSGPSTDNGDLHDVSGSPKVAETEAQASVLPSQDRSKFPERSKEVILVPKKPSNRNQDDVERASKEKIGAVPRSPPRSILKSEAKCIAVTDPGPVKKSSSSLLQQNDKSAPSISSQPSFPSKGNPQKPSTSRLSEKPTEVPSMSRPSSAPLIPGPSSRPPAPVVSMVQTSPLLARSVSAAGRLGLDPSPATHSYVPQSYRNAIVGSNPPASSSSGFAHPQSPGPVVNTSPVYTQPPALAPGPGFVPQTAEKMDSNSVKSSFSFGMLSRDVMQNGHQWIESARRDAGGDPSFQNLDLYKPVHDVSREQLSESATGTSGRQTQGLLADDFPHLDIINDLLDDEHCIRKVPRANSFFQCPSNNGPHYLTRQYSYPGDMGMLGEAGSPTSTCRFERTHSYQPDGFQQGFGPSDIFNSFQEYIPQGNPMSYANGQIDGLMPNQWPVAGSDLSMLGGSRDGDAYPYHIPEYTNLACSVNGYPLFRPSNGH